MTCAHYQHNLSLTEAENALVEALKEDGLTTIAIFRKGLEYYAPKVPKKLTDKAKGLVK